MNVNEIKAALTLHNESMGTVARRLGVSRTSVHLVIHRRMVSRRIMVAIAKAIGKDIYQVFPEQFRRDHPEAGASAHEPVKRSANF